MKKVLSLLLSCLFIPSLALAQSSVYTRNDTAATTLQSQNLGSSKAAVDSKGRLYTSISEGTNVATVRDTGASDSLNVSIVDGSGTQVTSFGGGGIQYTEGDVDATITGTAAMWEDAGNVMTPISAAKPLPIDITDATLAVTQSGTWNINNVSGTISLPTGAATSANQTTEITALQLIDNLPNTIGSTTSGQSGALSLGATTTGAPTYTTGQSNPLSLTTVGNLRVDGSSVTQPVSGTVTSNAGTGTFQTNVAQINGVTPLMGNGVTGTGSHRVTIASDNTAFTVNAAQSGTWNINNVSGTVSLPTGASTSANQTTEITALQLIDNLPNTIGSTTSGQSGALSMGAVTTGAPTYTTAQTHPLSLSTTGNLRVDGSSVTQPVSGTVTANAGTGTFATNVSQINGVTPLMGNGVTGTGSHRVTLASDSTGVVGLAANAANGYTKYTFGALVGTVQTVKGSAGTMGGYYVFNGAATVCYLQIFDNAGAITLGTTAPDLSFGIPAGGAANIDAGAPGILFSAAIKIAATTTRSNATACGTGMDVNIYYK